MNDHPIPPPQGEARRLHAKPQEAKAATGGSERDSAHRVVVSGLGLVTALGVGVEEIWQGLIEGRSGIGEITAFDASRLPVRIAGEVKGFVAAKHIENRKTLKVMSRSDTLGMAAARMAWQDAGLDKHKPDAARAGLYVACGKEPTPSEGLGEAVARARTSTGEVDYRLLGELSDSLVPPLFFLDGLPVTCLFYLSESLEAHGRNVNLVGTGDSSMQAIGQAFRAVQRGEADVALAGGFDCCCDWWNLCRYYSLGAVSLRNDDPAGACRPFDATRDGAVMSEGAAFVVLESLEHAMRRRATRYGEVAGYAAACDAFDVVRPHPEGRGLAAALRRALAEAGLPSGSGVDYIAAHGSGTVLGDKSETAAIKDALGESAYRVPVSAVKSMIGDAGAAAGAIGFGTALLALRTGVIPPTINYRHPDRHCDLDYVPNRAREAAVQVAAAIGRGQAGQSAVLIVKKPATDSALFS